MVRTVNASFYTDSLVVEGFPTKGEYDIELYSVSYGEVVSTPLVVKVSPDTPPYQKVRGKSETRTRRYKKTSRRYLDTGIYALY